MTDISLAPALPATGAAPATSAAPAATPDTLVRPTFDVLPLSREVRESLAEMGYLHPTPVQLAVWEPATRGKDAVVQARTGTGKTAAFGLPLVDHIVRRSVAHVQALILTPTRELALQVAAEVEKLGAKKGVRVTAIYGGAPMQRQIDAIADGAQVLVGTPGRVLDHLRRGTIDAKHIRLLVLDESDEMLSMGFERELTAILENLPKERQTLLFSATVPPDIERMAKTRLRSPEFITLSGDHIGALEIDHFVYLVPGDKLSALVRMIEVENPESAVVFCNTKDETERVAQALSRKGYDADWLNGDLPQNDREKVMAATRAGRLRFLVATDVAARGIDISHLTHVINHDFPQDAESYVHRTGRTGRAGRTGTAISLITPRDVGGLYLLRLTYKIRPIEKQIPSEGDLKTRAEADLVAMLVEAFGAKGAHPDDLALARRLLTHDQCEAVLAGLLRDHLGARPNAREEATAARRVGVRTAAPVPSLPAVSTPRLPVRREAPPPVVASIASSAPQATSPAPAPSPTPIVAPAAPAAPVGPTGTRAPTFTAPPVPSVTAAPSPVAPAALPVAQPAQPAPRGPVAVPRAAESAPTLERGPTGDLRGRTDDRGRQGERNGPRGDRRGPPFRREGTAEPEPRAAGGGPRRRDVRPREDNPVSAEHGSLAGTPGASPQRHSDFTTWQPAEEEGDDDPILGEETRGRNEPRAGDAPHLARRNDRERGGPRLDDGRRAPQQAAASAGTPPNAEPFAPSPPTSRAAQTMGSPPQPRPAPIVAPREEAGRTDEGEGDRPDGDFCEIYVNVGRREGARAADFQRVLTERGGIDKGAVRRVRVRERNAFVSVQRADLAKAIAALGGATIAGKIVSAEQARDRVGEGDAEGGAGTPGEGVVGTRLAASAEGGAGAVAAPPVRVDADGADGIADGPATEKPA